MIAMQKLKQPRRSFELYTDMVVRKGIVADSILMPFPAPV